MNVTRPTAALCVALIFAYPRLVQASPDDVSVKRSPHLLQASVHMGQAGLLGDVDGHYPQSAQYYGLGAGYVYALQNVDLGAEFDFLHALGADSSPRAYVPTFVVRPHVALGYRVDLGLNLRAGWSWMVMDLANDSMPGRRNHVFGGWQLGLAPDTRIRFSRTFALDIGAEALIVTGTDSSNVKAWYFDQRAAFIALGGFVRGSFGL